MVLPDYIRRAALGGGPTDLKMIKDWLESGGDINDVDADGETLLSLCLAFERPEFVKWAISRGADVNQPGNPDGDAPLFTAIGSGGKEFALDVIPLLLDAGARINATSPTAVDGCYLAGETALSYAIDWFRYDRHEAAEKALAYVSLLLRKGASLGGCWAGRSAEECLRHVEEPGAFPELEGAYNVTDPPTGANKKHFIACKKLFADERRRRYLLPRRAFLRLRSLALRGRAKPDSLLASVVRLPNELAWHVLTFWPAEADTSSLS